MKTLWYWIIAFIVLGVLLYIVRNNSEKTIHLNYSQFMEMVAASKITEVTFEKANTLSGKTSDGENIKVYLPAPALASQQLIEELQAKGIKINAESLRANNMLFWLVIALAPLLILPIIFSSIFKQSKDMMNQQMNWRDKLTRAQIQLPTKEKTKFADVAGIDEAKAELQEVIEFLKNPQKFTRLGAKMPHGILLLGPPGCGKTLLAKAVAGEADAKFFPISAASFVQMFVGVGAGRVRDLFNQARKETPSIVFIDEIDAVGRQRGTGIGSGHDEREQTLDEIFINMDGFAADEGVIVIAATNRPDILDEALIRPGRFDRHIVVPQPDLNGRVAILKVHTRKIKLDPEVDLEKVARLTPGFSGAYLATLVNEATLTASREDVEFVSTCHFLEARDRIIMGPAKKTLISDEDKKVIAYHEAGHTLAAVFSPEADPVEKVSIIPRGLALGVTMQIPEKDRYIKSKSYLITQLVTLLGGRVAEEIVFGIEKISSGASNDLERVTNLAEQMICQWGMGSINNFRTFRPTQGAPFLGLKMTQNRSISEKTAEIVDGEINQLIFGAYESVRKILTENRAVLDRLAQELIEKETLSADEIDKILRQF